MPIRATKTIDRKGIGIHVSGQSDGDPLAMWMVEYEYGTAEITVRKLTQIGNAPALITNLSECPSLFNKARKCMTHTHDEYETVARIPVSYDPANKYAHHDEVDYRMQVYVNSTWPEVQWNN